MSTHTCTYTQRSHTDTQTYILIHITHIAHTEIYTHTCTYIHHTHMNAHTSINIYTPYTHAYTHMSHIEIKR